MREGDPQAPPEQGEGTIGSGGEAFASGREGAFYLKSRTFVDKGMTTQ